MYIVLCMVGVARVGGCSARWWVWCMVVWVLCVVVGVVCDGGVCCAWWT